VTDARAGERHVENLNNVFLAAGLLRFATTVVEKLNNVPAARGAVEVCHASPDTPP
jgi:hypothetical protein